VPEFRGPFGCATNDRTHANADFQKALQLDPSLRADMLKEIGNIDERHRQEDAARGTVRRMASYFVEKDAHTQEQCEKYICSWKQGECGGAGGLGAARGGSVICLPCTSMPCTILIPRSFSCMAGGVGGVILGIPGTPGGVTCGVMPGGVGIARTCCLARSSKSVTPVAGLAITGVAP
jgi:hypothetical protein